MEHGTCIKPAPPPVSLYCTWYFVGTLDFSVLWLVFTCVQLLPYISVLCLPVFLGFLS